MTRTVYGLCDPRNGELRYIGVGVRPKSRWNHHVNERVLGRKAASARARWIAELLADGRKPELLEIETVAAEHGDEAESFWIAYYRSIGANLTNVTPQQKSDIQRQGLLKRYARPEERRRTAEQTRARYDDPAARALTSEVMARVTRTPEGRAKARAGTIRRFSNPEERAKQSARMRDWWARKRSDA